MKEQVYDLLVVGGGINGVGAALDAQGRGLKTALVEMKDLASATSSASSKLIHGGLRYLEHYEFRLVREALNEREVVFHKAPHIVKPMRFILPHRPHLRPSWMIRSGLFLYDVLGKRDVLPGSKFLKFGKDNSPLKPEINKGYEYSDCWVDDARLVTLNAMQCRDLGGDIFTRTKCIGAKQENDLWHIQVRDELTGKERTLKAKGLVNAAGPWVKALLTQELSRTSPRGIRLIKGSHIVVPKIHDQEQAYILQNEDGRIVFVIPYLDKFSIVGTTDVEHKGEPDSVAISQEEIDYLCKIVNQHFTRQISPADVVWTYSGVRPLCDDESDSPQAVTRDYTIELETEGKLPLLSVFGGKLTTYRKLSEAVMNKLKPFYPSMGHSWTATSQLPGGNIGADINAYIAKLRELYPFLTQETAKRLATTYGTRAEMILGEAESLSDLGIDFGSDLTQNEVDYLVQYEFACTAEDVLWRRTKMGLFLNAEQQSAVSDYIEKKAVDNRVAA
ncbi:glycerol-3-phosphate dehydrogenase [Hahella sp. CCB-MM4]|uniref:glycerol-3-phosphate dehydrogenase n=1 Tax=Hahella sp. (strain CCB-MM4) TaxID=1926491 RepID=UPI000B9A4E11|nr:glycerol-3-phosphate dehydrogenase [Hahella sp. CCB-MM4]OZG73134.1 glycerol-3-phosphate dehydrogenase [Hahella sp. CCB-MM4]